MPVTMGAVQAGVGLAQTIFGGIRAHKTQKQLENLKTPYYTANKPIGDYYKEAYNRYNTSPYASQGYQYANEASGRSMASGLSALQGRRSAISGVSRLSAIQNDAMLKAGVNAENERNQRFGQLGSATGMKSADDLRAFQQNKIAPYEKKANLLAMKASGANKFIDAGMNNIFGGMGSASMVYNDNKLNQQQGQSGGGGGYYPVDYSTVPINNTGYGAPPNNLSKTRGSLMFG